jgi:hypothetical protein
VTTLSNRLPAKEDEASGLETSLRVPRLLDCVGVHQGIDEARR